MASTLLRDTTPVAVTAGRNGGYGTPATLQVWDLAAGRPHSPPRPLRTSHPWALTCTRLPDGTALAAPGGDGEPEQDGVVEIWDLTRNRAPHVIGVPEPVMGLAFTAGHRLIVRTYLDIRVYDPALTGDRTNSGPPELAAGWGSVR